MALHCRVAVTVASLLQVLPETFIVTRAGLAILSSLQDAFVKAFSTSMQFGALVAFVVAATPFAVLGITSAFWAIVAGSLASFLAERRQRIGSWTAADN